MTKHFSWVLAAMVWAFAGCGATTGATSTGGAAEGSAACECGHAGCEGKAGACAHDGCQGGACPHAECQGKDGACAHKDCAGKDGACDHHGAGACECKGGECACEHCKGDATKPCTCSHGAPGAKACGCKHGAGHAHGHGHGHGHAKGEGHGHHPGMPAEVAAYHEVLRPVWHAPANREALACEKSADLTAKGAGLGAMTLTGDADAARTALVTATADLSAACAAKPRAGIDAKLETLHTAFHKLMELTTPGGHGPGHACGGQK